MALKKALIITTPHGTVPQALVGMNHLVKERITIFSGEKPALAEEIRQRYNLILIDGEMGNDAVNEFFNDMKNLLAFLNIPSEVYCFGKKLDFPNLHFMETPLKDFLEKKLI